MEAVERKEGWIERTWRPAAAVVYLIICVFDFIVAPVYQGITHETTKQLAKALTGLDPTVAIAIIQSGTTWEPLTLMGGGTFHIAFGAILGVAAWTRGTEKVEQLRQRAWGADEPASEPRRGR